MAISATPPVLRGTSRSTTAAYCAFATTLEHSFEVRLLERTVRNWQNSHHRRVILLATDTQDDDAGTILAPVLPVRRMFPMPEIGAIDDEARLGSKDRHARPLFVEKRVQMRVAFMHTGTGNGFDLLLGQLHGGEALELRLAARERFVFLRRHEIACDLSIYAIYASCVFPAQPWAAGEAPWRPIFRQRSPGPAAGLTAAPRPPPGKGVLQMIASLCFNAAVSLTCISYCARSDKHRAPC